MIPPCQDRQDGRHYRAQHGLVGLDGAEAHVGEGSPVGGAPEVAAAGGEGGAASCHIAVRGPLLLLLSLLLLLPQLGLLLLRLRPPLSLASLLSPAGVLPLLLPSTLSLLLLLRSFLPLPLLLPLGLSLPRAARARAGAVSLGLLWLLPLLLPLMLRLVLALGRS